MFCYYVQSTLSVHDLSPIKALVLRNNLHVVQNNGQSPTILEKS